MKWSGSLPQHLGVFFGVFVSPRLSRETKLEGKGNREPGRVNEKHLASTRKYVVRARRGVKLHLYAIPGTAERAVRKCRQGFTGTKPELFFLVILAIDYEGTSCKPRSEVFYLLRKCFVLLCKIATLNCRIF